jgi:hypothetical protein
MIILGPVRTDVAPELARIDPLAASEWFGWQPDARMESSALAAALRGRGTTQLAEIIEAIGGDPRWGWLAVHSELLKTLSGSPAGDGFALRVEEWFRVKGVRIMRVCRERAPARRYRVTRQAGEPLE